MKDDHVQVVKRLAAKANGKPGVKPAPATPPAGTTGLRVRTMADVVTKVVPWLWPGRVPLGMLTLLDGDPSLGKSTITADLAARLTRGDAMPGGADPCGPPADALFLAAEDSAEFTIRPRLEAAGADLSRCHLLDATDLGDRERPPKLPDDLPMIESLILARGIRLVVIDPILGYLSGGIDSNSDQSARDVLHALKLTAERTGAAVVCLRHLNKRGAGPAMYRGGGSIAFTAAARSALVAAKHPDRPDLRVLATTKCNIAATPQAIEYAMEDAGGVPRIAWGDLLDVSADDLLATAVPAGRSRTRKTSSPVALPTARSRPPSCTSGPSPPGSSVAPWSGRKTPSASGRTGGGSAARGSGRCRPRRRPPDSTVNPCRSGCDRPVDRHHRPPRAQSWRSTDIRRRKSLCHNGPS